jgi:hypothetical protein
MSRIRITYDGRLVLTTAQAAQRYALTPVSMRKALSRLALDPLPESLDGRTPLYPAAELDRAMKARPGRGNHGTSDARPAQAPSASERHV